MRKTWEIDHLDCANCAAELERALNALPLVEKAVVDYVSRKVTVTAPDADFDAAAEAVLAETARLEPEARIHMDEEHGHSHHHGGESRGVLWRAVGAAGLAAAALMLSGTAGTVLFVAAYLLAGYDILLAAVRNIGHGRIFDENFLMSVASLGAMLMGECAEGVAVLVLYQVGEWFQDRAVDKSRASIAALTDIRPDHANRLSDGQVVQVSPEEVDVGEMIIIRPGERVPLDGVVTEGSSSLNTVALTGESMPRDVHAGDSVLSGSVNLSGMLTVQVTAVYGESGVAKILRLVEESGQHKAGAEKFITRFARRYTPLVCLAAALLAVLPPIFDGQWLEWLRRALTFLVISCPCALVISVPLTFFSGIGGASRKGVLVKGANHVETLARLDAVVFDKTGTLTRGEFAVEKILPSVSTEAQLLEMAALAESGSDHPIARSVLEAYGKDIGHGRVTAMKEIAGKGVMVEADGQRIHAGNARLMEAIHVEAPAVQEIGTIVHVAADGVYQGCLVIADALKSTAVRAMQELRGAGVNRLAMLTGDSRAVAESVASALGMTDVRAELMPGDKVEHLESLMNGAGVAFVGDGINDAPVLRRADVGIAMGGVGSDAAIEAADVVIMDDDLLRLPGAIRIARKTMAIVRQNIIFALGVKLAVMLLGALGIANMWIAVFADVGVAMLTILNAMRAMK